MSTATVLDPVVQCPRSQPGDPPWEIAMLFPAQGQWSEEEYLALQSRTNLLVELSNGCIEEGQTYRVHGEFGRGSVATSVLLPGFSAPVDAVYAAGQGIS